MASRKQIIGFFFSKQVYAQSPESGPWRRRRGRRAHPPAALPAPRLLSILRRRGRWSPSQRTCTVDKVQLQVFVALPADFFPQDGGCCCCCCFYYWRRRTRKKNYSISLAGFPCPPPAWARCPPSVCTATRAAGWCRSGDTQQEEATAVVAPERPPRRRPRRPRLLRQ